MNSFSGQPGEDISTSYITPKCRHTWHEENTKKLACYLLSHLTEKWFVKLTLLCRCRHWRKCRLHFVCVYIYVYICLCAKVYGSMCPAAVLIYTRSPADERPASCSAILCSSSRKGALSPSSGWVPRCLAQPDCAGKPRAAHRPAGPSCSKPFIWGLL